MGIKIEKTYVLFYFGYSWLVDTLVFRWLGSHVLEVDCLHVVSLLSSADWYVFQDFLWRPTAIAISQKFHSWSEIVYHCIKMAQSSPVTFTDKINSL